MSFAVIQSEVEAIHIVHNLDISYSQTKVGIKQHNPQGFIKSTPDFKQQLFGWKQVSWQPHSCFFKVQDSCQCNVKTSLSLTEVNWHLPNERGKCFYMCQLSTFGDNGTGDGENL